MNSNDIGKRGERLFQQIMENQGYKVEDVSNNADYWYRDIDFIITSPTTGKIKTFEVKTDTKINRTGNLYLEFTNIHSKGGKGWFQFCEADYLAYCDAVNNIFYIINMQKLRQRLPQLPTRWAQCGDDSTGLLLAIDLIKDITSIL